MITVRGVGNALDPSLTLRTGAIIPFGARGIAAIRRGQIVHQVENLGRRGGGGHGGGHPGRGGRRTYRMKVVAVPEGAPPALVQQAQTQAAAVTQQADKLACALMDAGGLAGDQILNVSHDVPCASVGSVPGGLCEVAKLFLAGRPVIGSFSGVRIVVEPVFHYPGSQVMARPPSGLSDPFDDGLGDFADALGAARRAARGRSSRGAAGRGYARGRGRVAGGRRAARRGRGLPRRAPAARQPSGPITVTPASQDAVPPVAPGALPGIPGLTPGALPGLTPAPGALPPPTAPPPSMMTTPVGRPVGFVPPPAAAVTGCPPGATRIGVQCQMPRQPGEAYGRTSIAQCPPGYRETGKSCEPLPGTPRPQAPGMPAPGMPGVPGALPGQGPCPPGYQLGPDGRSCYPAPGYPPGYPPPGYPGLPGQMPGLPQPSYQPDAMGVMHPTCPPGFQVGPGGGSCLPAAMPGLPGGMPGLPGPTDAGGGGGAFAPPPPAAPPPPPAAPAAAAAAAAEDDFEEDEEGEGSFDEEDEEMEGWTNAPYASPFNS